MSGDDRMRRIAHISDLHFGADDPLVAEGLLDDIAGQKPQLVAVSGDLTQRARKSQFAAARAYLARIGVPQVVVPGNHDIPLYNVVDRFIRPLQRYRHFISHDLHPFYQDAEIAVAGVNTARSDTWKEGRISVTQIEHVQRQFDSVGDDLFKVLVCHHPFLPRNVHDPGAVVGRVRLALKMLEACGCAIILSGHLHQAYSGDVRPHYAEITRSILVAQAGTAISHRRRDEANAYNQLTLDGNTLTLEVRAWDGRQFATTGCSVFEQAAEGWCLCRS